MNERRRDRRNPVELPIIVKVGKKAHAATTVNVSFKGISVRMDEPPPVRNLVQLELDLPVGRLSGHAMVVHVSDKIVGMEFFGRGLGEQWDEYVMSVGRNSLSPPGASVSPPGGPLSPPGGSPSFLGSGPPAPPSAPPPLPSMGAPPIPTTPPRPITGPGQQLPAPQTGPRTGPQAFTGAERRRAPRIPLRLELRLRTPRSIHTGYTTEISMLSAGMLIQDLQVSLGEQVIVNLIQPGTSFSFRRDGVVRRTSPLEGGWSHVGIEFTALEPMREVLFADFMNVAYATIQGKGG